MSKLWVPNFDKMLLIVVTLFFLKFFREKVCGLFLKLKGHNDESKAKANYRYRLA